MEEAGPHRQPLRTWLAHALAVGAGVGLLFPATLVVTVMALDPSSPPPAWAIVKLQLAAPLAAMVVAGLAALPAAVAARVAWPMGRVPAMSLGPVLGALAGVGLWIGIEVLLEPHRALEWRPIPWIALAGAAGVGPPWVAYLAVLARGRGGWSVALATPFWAMMAIASSIFFLWLRFELGYDR